MTSKKKFYSLKLKTLLLLVLSTAAAVGIYYLMSAAGYRIISQKYLSDQSVTVRTASLAAEFQSYIGQNGISSTDLESIGGWTMEKRYVSVLVFQNGIAKSEAGSWGASSLEGSDYAKLYEDSANSYVFTPVAFADGTFQVALDDYSYTRYYMLADTVSIIIAALVVLGAMLMFTNKVTGRIKRLSESVKEIERGDLDLEIPARGHDEVAGLAASMDNMRVSINDRIRSESAARKANSDLIAAISHDIRTPLTTLIGYLELLQDGTYSSEEQRGQYTDAAHDKAMRLKELTDELFSYFLVYDDSAIPVKIEEFDAEILLDQLLGDYIIELKDSGRRVIVNNLDCDCVIRGDVMFLKRVFDNIFSNVGKHSDADKPVIIMAKREEDGKVHISVTNSVPAVPNRVESTKVGLKTCEKLMGAMGGDFRTVMEGGKFMAEVVVPLKKDKS